MPNREIPYEFQRQTGLPVDELNRLGERAARALDVSGPGMSVSSAGVRQRVFNPDKFLAQITAADASTPTRYSWVAVDLDVNQNVVATACSMVGTATNSWALYPPQYGTLVAGDLVELRRGDGEWYDAEKIGGNLSWGASGGSGFTNMSLTATNVWQQISAVSVHAITQPGKYMLVYIAQVQWQVAPGGIGDNQVDINARFHNSGASGLTFTETSQGVIVVSADYSIDDGQLVHTRTFPLMCPISVTAAAVPILIQVELQYGVPSGWFGSFGGEVLYSTALLLGGLPGGSSGGGSGMSIGGAVVGATPNDILTVGAGSVLAQVSGTANQLMGWNGSGVPTASLVTGANMSADANISSQVFGG